MSQKQETELTKQELLDITKSLIRVLSFNQLFKVICFIENQLILELSVPDEDISRSRSPKSNIYWIKQRYQQTPKGERNGHVNGYHKPKKSKKKTISIPKRQKQKGRRR